jgi:hypothetical protein
LSFVTPLFVESRDIGKLGWSLTSGDAIALAKHSGHAGHAPIVLHRNEIRPFANFETAAIARQTNNLGGIQGEQLRHFVQGLVLLVRHQKHGLHQALGDIVRGNHIHQPLFDQLHGRHIARMGPCQNQVRGSH